MNNNDTNNLGSNGLNSNDLGVNSNPTLTPPVNNGINQGVINNPQNNDMQGMSLGSFSEMQNGAPAMVTPEVPPVVGEANQGVNLLNNAPVDNVEAQPSVINTPVMNPNELNSTITLEQPQMENVAPVETVVTPPVTTPVVDQNLGMQQPTDIGMITPNTQTMNDQSMMNNGMQFMNMNQPSMNSNVGLGATPQNDINSISNQGIVNNNVMPSNNPFANTPNLMQQQPSMNDPFAQPNMGMNPNMNGNVFGAVPTPPIEPNNNGKKKGGKSKLNKTTIILLAVLLIAIIGCAVYLVLNNAGSKTPKGDISTKDLVLELGKELSTNVSDYALITGFNASTCTVDTSKVNTKRMGSYEYTVTCGSTSKVGNIVLQDKTAPVVTVREVMVTPGSMISIDDFIVACDDYTECSYELEDSTQSLETLVATVGNYSLNLVVSDDYDNTTTVTLSLIVSESAPVRHMYCTPTPTQDDTLKANVEVAYNYGINMDDVLARTEKTYVYTFDNEEDYLAVKNSYSETTGINDVVGPTVFDNANFTITITVNMTDAELGTEFNMNPFPTDYESLRQFNLDQGITCKNR